MNLEEMQKLPHKWWKKDVQYVPCVKDIPADFEAFEVRISVLFNTTRILALHQLRELTLHSKIVPTECDWYYAINTELLEYFAATDETGMDLELADIAIFCALCLKYFFQYDILELVAQHGYHKHAIIKPLSRSHGIKNRIIDLLLWALQSPAITEKIQYNQERVDHGHFRH